MDESTFEALGESIASKNEWVSSGAMVHVHESIDPSSEVTEVDIAGTLGSSVTNGRALDLSYEVCNFSNLFFEF
jgi:hypothetical protein